MATSVNDYLAEYGTLGNANVSNRPQPKQDQSKKSKKRNFWLDQISTGTGIAGGILGSLIAPIAGTAGGAAAGGALGEAIENLIDPEGGNWGNVGKEALVSGVMGAGPIKLLKGAGAGAKALATGADDVAKVASKAALTPLRQKAGQALTGAADDLAIKQFRLTPTQLTNFQKKFGEDAGAVIRRYGFQNADDIVAKGIDPLQQQFDEAITGITGVTKDSLQKNITKRINQLAKAGPSDSKAMASSLRREADQLFKGYGDVIDAKELNVIRRQFDDLVNYTEKAANPSRYGVNKRMADALRETLQQADQTGNLKNLGKELNKLRQLSENVARQGNLGRGSLPFGLGMAPGAIFGASGGPMGAAAGMAAQQVANSPTGRRMLMSGAERVGNKLASSGATTQTAKGIAGRVGTTGVLGGLMGQSLENSTNAPNTMSPSMNIPSTSNMGSQYTDLEQSASPFSRGNILEAMLIDIQETGGKNLDKIQMLYEFANPQDEQKPLSQGQQERADLVNSIGLVENLMGAGSINYGPIGSRVEGIKSFFNAADPETLSYKHAVSGLQAAITKARAGASLTEGEKKLLAQYTPSDTDSEQVVRSKLAQLKALYGGSMPSQGAGTLEDALMQYAGAF